MKIFSIQNRDYRRDFIKAVEHGEPFVGQKPKGKDVEYFSPETGFCLLEKKAKLSPDAKFVRRAYVAAKLSLGPKLELREFYYTGRQTPWFMEAYEGIKPDSIYDEVLIAINNLEIICDLDRVNFTVGNLSKGIIFYGHSYTYGNKERKIAFTENIARYVLKDWEIDTAQNIIIVEKNSAANRLVELGFSELTNSVIVTVGGFFNRGIYELVKRFKDKKNIIFLTDADVYGLKMLATVVFGSDRSRHLPYRFPSSKYPRVHMAGLFPSIGEKLGLPNDVEQKRPLQNKEVQRMLDHIKKYKLVDERDIATWERDKTYELEALSTFIKNKKGEPVGLGVYLTEYMRLRGLPVKPMPPEDDEELIKELEEDAKSKLMRKINPEIDTSFIDELVDEIKKPIEEFLEQIREEIIDKYIDELKEHVKKQSAEIVRRHLLKQYEENPERERYDMNKVSNKLFKTVEVSVSVDLDEIKTRIKEMIEELKPKIEEVLEEAEYEEVIEFKDLEDPGEPRDLYDVTLEALGVKPDDVIKVREAIKWRLG